MHGLTGNENKHLFFNGSKFFLENKFDTFRFNLYDSREKGSVLSECSITTHSQDIDVVVNFFKKKYKNICLIGQSLVGLAIIYSS